MSKHTPTPWHTSGDLIVGAPEAVPNPQVAPYPKQVAKLQWDYEGDSGATECRIQWPEAAANAALIVRAVNCHDDLLAALRALLARMEGESEWLDKAGYPAAWMVERHDNILTPARAAIAKATQ